MYLTKELVREALLNVQSFEHELDNLFASYDYDLRSNLGRRNALCSQAQEKELAKSLSKHFKSVIQDGAPGKPDIFIGDINKELECKLTSGNRGGSVSYSLQTDWVTLENKGSLDYLYVLCDEQFENFCVLYFENLTTNDFYPPANGSRGKSRMKKSSAMKKAVCLHGSFTTQNENYINTYTDRISENVDDYLKKVVILQKKYLGDFKSDDNVKVYNKLKTGVQDKLISKIDGLVTKLNYWKDTDPRYSFKLAPLIRENNV
tara:strand:- start:1999 stop:2781 length:783 start_codon:yes stop_codon:yes gene_type:complete